MPVPIEVVRRHCHLDDDALAPQTDALLKIYINAAVNWFEGQTHRSVVSRTHRWILAEFPYDCDDVSIRLPRGKTQSVDSIAYVSGNQTTTLTGPSASPPGTGFSESLIGDDGGLIMPPYGGSWPSTDYEVPAPVTITFQAGWTLSQIPDDVKYALLFYCSDAYELRGTSDLDTAGRNLDARTSLISPYSLHRWY